MELASRLHPTPGSARIGISALFVAFVISFLEIESASGEVVGGVIEITSFTRMMSFVFYGALLLAAIATSYRMPARLSARAPTEKDSESRAEALVAALMDNRRQVDFHILLMMVGLGMCLMAMASNLFFMFVAIELASLAAYVLVAFHKEGEAGGEAGRNTSLLVQLLVLPESMECLWFIFGQGTSISMH